MKLDILVIMAHPDDAELSCSGTIISSVKMGMKVGMIDLTMMLNIEYLKMENLMESLNLRIMKTIINFIFLVMIILNGKTILKMNL